MPVAECQTIHHGADLREMPCSQTLSGQCKDCHSLGIEDLTLGLGVTSGALLQSLSSLPRAPHPAQVKLLNLSSLCAQLY